MIAKIKGLIKIYRDDESFRDKVNLYSGALTSFVFVVIQLYGGIKYQSAWFTALAVYNLILAVIRFYLGCSVGKKGNDAWRTFQIVGVVLVALNIALIVMISMMIADPSLALHDYSMAIAVVNAFWTLGAAVMTVYGFVDVQKKDNPIVLADRTVALVTAAVSVLMLQTSLVASLNGPEIEISKAYLAEFSSLTSAPDEISEIISSSMEALATSNTITGVVVAMLAGGASSYMIIHGLSEKRRVNREGS